MNCESHTLLMNEHNIICMLDLEIILQPVGYLSIKAKRLHYSTNIGDTEKGQTYIPSQSALAPLR